MTTHAPSISTSVRTMLRALGGLAIALSLAPALACDSGGDDKPAAEEGGEAKEGGAAGATEKATKAQEEVTEMKGRLDKGEDIKFACAGNLAQYEELKASAEASEKEAYDAMLTVCYVDGPRKTMADIRASMEKGEFSSFDTVDLTTVIEADDFPKDGEYAKVAEEAKKLLEVEVPIYDLDQALADAAKDKEEGKSVSMGCIKAKQVVDKSKAALEADEAGKAKLEAYTTACPEE